MPQSNSQSWKLRHLAKVTVDGLIDGTVTVADVVQRIREIKDPYMVAYYALSVVSYLPDNCEILLRSELRGAIDHPTTFERPKQTAEAHNQPVVNKG